MSVPGRLCKIVCGKQIFFMCVSAWRFSATLFVADPETIPWCLLWLASVPSSAGGEGFSDQAFQHLLIYISKLLDIEAAFAGRVLAELG